MHLDILKQKIIQNTKKRKLIKKLSLIIGVFGVCILNFFLLDENKKNKPSENIISTALLSLFTFLSGYNAITIFDYYPSRKKSVSKNILDSLNFQSNNADNTLYSSLKKSDIEKFVSHIDLSSISKEKQLFLLQQIIEASNKHPSLAKLFKNDFLPTTIIYKDDIKYHGALLHEKDVIVQSEIHLKPQSEFRTFLHEIIHAKQSIDGAFNFKKLSYFAEFINEAQAKAYTLLLEKNEAEWINKIIDHTLKQIKQTNPNLSIREQQGKAEESTIALLSKCLITEHDFKVTRNLLDQYCPNVLNETEITKLYQLCLIWRLGYENKKVTRLAQKLNTGLKISNNEAFLFKQLTRYIQNNALIPILPTDIHINQRGYPLKKVYANYKTNQRE